MVRNQKIKTIKHVEVGNCCLLLNDHQSSSS